MLDRDLFSIQNARDLVNRSHEAQKQLAKADQAAVDRIVDAAARAATDHARDLARLAVEETGMGRVESKIAKNLLCSQKLHEAHRNLRTCGVIREDAQRGIIEVAEPVGVVAGIIPTTNPTSTTIFKVLIALKGRNSIVLSPHPRAIRCIERTAEILRRAAVAAGAPEDIVLCLREPTLDGTHELMKHRLTSMIVATGGPGVVKAAYSSGKPAFGVGPGNPAVFIHRSADLDHAARCLIESQNFDYGTICSSEQALVVERSVANPFREALERAGAHFANEEETRLLEQMAIQSDGSLNTAIVGQSPARLAEMAGLDVSPDVRLLIAPQGGVGPEYPLSRETLCPLLAWYETDDWKTGCKLCMRLIRYGGSGHTMGMYCRDRDIVLAFGLEKPVGRLIVNGPTTQGAVGYSTRLEPSMTLGCGTMGGNITSDNIGPRHLINVKRIAFPDPAFFDQTDFDADASNLYAPVAGSTSNLPAPPSGERASNRTGSPFAGQEFFERALRGAARPPS